MSDLNDMIEVKLNVDENIIKETLSRLGIANKKDKILYPTCYLYRNFEKFYIVHFKDLFCLTRTHGYNNLSVDDVERTKSIIHCLKEWNLIDLVGSDSQLKPHNKFIYVLPHKDKKNWTIQHKFNINNVVFAD